MMPLHLSIAKKLATVVDNELVDPRNIDNVIDNIQKLRAILEERLNTAYECTKIRRVTAPTLQSTLVSKNIQFLRGDWVLLSRAGLRAGRIRLSPIGLDPIKFVAL